MILINLGFFFQTKKRSRGVFLTEFVKLISVSTPELPGASRRPGPI